MKIRIIDYQQVRRLLDMETCIELMASALTTLAEGSACQPLRSAMHLASGKGLLGLMPAYLGDIDAHAVKAISVFPGNHGSAYDAHQGVVVLYEGQHGCPIAVMDGSEITAIRTAAASALATRLLAREDSRILALIGSGIQARSHLEAMRCVRPVAEVRVCSRNMENARRFAERESARFDLPITAYASAEQAVANADIICTTTASTEPVLFGSMLPPGCHINAVGACFAAARELDSEAVAKARLYTDRLESLENEAGDYLVPLGEGLISADHVIGEIGDLLIGKISGRGDTAEITLFKSLGIAVEDLAAAQHIYQQALQSGLGTSLAFGEAPDEGD